MSKAPSADKETVESKIAAQLNDQVKELQATIKACNNETDMKDIFFNWENEETLISFKNLLLRDANKL